MTQKSILLTGGAGFIGSNLVHHLLKKYPNYKIINLDLLTYAGDLKNLSSVEEHPNYKFYHGDICDRELVEKIFSEHKINGVFHLAAESHVDNSITNPEAFVKTNVMGTFNLLDVAKRFWMNGPQNYKEEFKDARFLHVSTDEVYGTLGETGYFTETTPYAPNSPYSASKAGSDLLVRSYFHTYGMNVVTTNCSNNYGPNQHDEKLIPTVIRNALQGNPIPVYGNGKNIRDWLFVNDHCLGLDSVFHEGRTGETYNIGTNNELQNLDLIKDICSYLDKVKPKAESYFKQVHFVADRPGHDKRYAIDSSKISKELGWKPIYTYEKALHLTIGYYMAKYI